MALRNKRPTKPSCSRADGIRTLSDLNRWSGPDSDSDDKDAPQEYYTGLVARKGRKIDGAGVFSHGKSDT
ncbi:hypothetical protein SADUNF_Sadunf04G0066000 [Salix dunnii]|uniref:Uncharacterized protein n=1 Tax=Salix dunnii TaxID=1413687 RepID=A0A835KF36_9ROSI|nr:hypothetical protein SADUNF_Sadunf04G0066000 [Salix dunnii]